MAVVLKTRRFTIDEYYRMAEAGILSEDDRVELIQGEIVEMPPIGSHHAGTVSRHNSLFASLLGGRVIVSVQNPLRLRSVESEFQPDVVLLRLRADFYTKSHPEPQDVYLVIEVADTSLEKDRQVKLPLYAKAGVREVWIVDLNADRVEVYRGPSPDGYRDVRVFQRGEAITVEAFPDLALTVADLLG
jgi:Uma2 family endonuclease